MAALKDQLDTFWRRALDGYQSVVEDGGPGSSPTTPPYRVVFRWDIGPTWQVEPDPDRTSEVEVTFTAETPGRTRIELEHRHLDRHGPGWESVRDGVGHDQAGPSAPPSTSPSSRWPSTGPS